MFKRIMWKIRDYRFDKRMARQRDKRGFSDNDCWGMCYWLCDTFPKMILNLRNMKNGYPELPFEEVENFPLQWVNDTAKEINELKVKFGYEEGVVLDDTVDRWQLILSRIAWCLQQASDEITEIENEYREEYDKQVWGDDYSWNSKKSFKQWWEEHTEVVGKDEKGKPTLYQLKTNEPDEDLREKFWNREEEIAKYREGCKDEALDLIKKYFYHLWD